MKVFVYWNFNKKLWSIRSIETGRVISYRHNLCLRDCEFKVSKAGRKRVLKEKRKNVHAGVIGVVTNKRKATIPVGYNPYKYETFINKRTLAPVKRANTVCFKDTGKCMMGEWQ